MRSEFEAAGARLTIVAGTDVGAPEFMEEVWQGGELWVDDEEKVSEVLRTFQIHVVAMHLHVTDLPAIHFMTCLLQLLCEGQWLLLSKILQK